MGRETTRCYASFVSIFLSRWTRLLLLLLLFSSSSSKAKAGARSGSLEERQAMRPIKVHRAELTSQRGLVCVFGAA